MRLGPEALPHLLKWVSHENLAVRYVAAYSLEQLTSIKAEIVWFDRKDAEQRRERAIARWGSWWETRDRNEVR
jgi:HEAT repeat protein